jgi:glycosyltransferase involved in cell wall biosynthesis
MARLAWFTPLPPIRSGIAQYNLELLPALSSSHQIDLFVDGPPDQFVRPACGARVFSAHDFVWRHQQQPYELVVYQLGNAPCHDYMWAYLVRYPGFVVLHDGQFHHARARWLLQQKREDDYRSEFWFNHPDANVDLAELAVAGLLGSLTYLWPMRRIVVESARLVAVHNQWLADEIHEGHPSVPVRVIGMGVPAPNVRPGGGDSIRRRHGIPIGAVVFAAFGKVTPEKRISEAIRAMAAMAEAVPNVHLLLAGESVDHYNPLDEATRLGVQGRVTVAGFVPEAEIPDYLAAADVCLCLRWPSAREASASWLRCIAAGRPTITTDLVHTADMPSLDPRTWTASAPAPVCVSIDIVDEDHSLRLAMRRLATDAGLRTVLAASARRLWAERFSLEHMVSEYRDAIESALTASPPDPLMRAHLPKHLLGDGTERAARLVREMGLSGRLDWRLPFHAQA